MNTNPMNPTPTPRTDAQPILDAGYTLVSRDFARTLERELTEARATLIAREGELDSMSAALAAKDSEIARLKADGAASAFVDMAIRAEHAEAELARFKEYAFCMESALRGARASGTASETALFRAESAELRLLNDQLRAEVEQWKKNYYAVADAICRESTSTEDLCAKARQLRADLAAAKADTAQLAGVIDKLWNHNEAVRAAVIKHYGLHHSDRVLAAIDAARSPLPESGKEQP